MKTLLTEKKTVNQYTVFKSVCNERKRQFDKWGIQSHTIPDWLMILGEEFGETCKAGNEVYFRQSPIMNLRKELVQTAAVAFAIIESIDNYTETEMERKINNLKLNVPFGD